ncbi:SH3 domain protein [Myxozyma melibiosi]|uniref:SH3 domain protein n=1 Tax=Myxozyma melibiosi TaxID=54550 RepID=A0ABR1FEN6_9ASCO
MANDAPPSVPLSFSNNFWGVEEKGVSVIFQRMREAKQTCEELKSFYKERTAIEEEYSRKLLALSRKPLGQHEIGSLRSSLDTLRFETEQMGKAHHNSSLQLRTELDEPLTTFSAGMRERRKIVQGTLEKLFKAKLAQQANVAKNRDRYENDCNKINGYIAQQNMLMGRELEKNNAKLEKAQVAVNASRRDYQASLRNLSETIEKWNREWKAGCDKFQDLEEERIDFLKSNIWAFSNIISTVCVSDDEYCENIRVSLERCDVEKDIVAFVRERATGQEIPDSPKYINFMDGSSAYSMETNNYTLAQFSRQTNLQYRSSDLEVSADHRLEDSENTKSGMVRSQSNQIDAMLASLSVSSPASAGNRTPVKAGDDSPYAAADNTRSVAGNVMERVPTLQYPEEALSSAHSSPVHRGRSPSGDSSFSHATTVSSSSENELSTPTKAKPDAASMLDQTPTPTAEKKKRGGWTSPFKRKSKMDLQNDLDDQDYIKPNTSSSPYGAGQFSKSRTNLESRSPSPAKSATGTPYGSPDKYGSSSFGHSRSESKVTPVAARSQMNSRNSPAAGNNQYENSDPRARYVLSVGENAFDVDPSSKKSAKQPTLEDADDEDPIAAALANLKGGEMPASQLRAEKKYGLGNGKPARGGAGHRVPSYSAPTSPQNNMVKSSANGAPPPSHMRQPDFSAAPQQSSLVPPAQVITAQEMRDTALEYTSKTQEMFQGGSRSGPQPRHAKSQSSLGGYSPQQRPVQQRPVQQQRPPSSQSQFNRPMSRGAPGYGQQQSPQQQEQYRSRSRAEPDYGREGPYAGGSPAAHAGAASRSASPGPQMMGRPRSAFAYESPNQYSPEQNRARSRAGGYENSPRGVSPHPEQQRPVSRQYQQDASPRGGYQGGNQAAYERPKSKSALDVRHPVPGELPQYSRDGREAIAYARALYDYRAMIPEEVSFRKGDVMLVLLMQEDGWWEAEVLGPRARPQLGLAPSNFLQTI